MTLKRLFSLLVILTVAGCSDERDSDSVEELPLESLPGVYSGVFPCDGCAGIAATLWLRADGRFFFRQRYPADDARDEMDTYNLGRWRLADGGQILEATGSGPLRTFMRIDADTLAMRTESELPHRLKRDVGAAAFTDALRMAGIMRTRGDSVTFTECLTGLESPVTKGGDFARFRHQYRVAGGPSKPAYVELEGRYSWSGDGAPQSLTIARFVTIKEGRSCPSTTGME